MLGKYPLDEVHYSDLAVYRECPAKFRYMAEGKRSTGSPYMLLGSVFHIAVQDAVLNGVSDEWHKDAQTAEYWHEQFATAEYLHPDDVYEGVDEEVIKKWIGQFIDPNTYYGVTVGTLIKRMCDWLRIGFGARIVGSEIEWRTNTDPPAAGAIDLLLKDKRGNLIIADVKTSGLWNRIINDKSITKQTLKPMQVLHHPQLKMYHWGLWQSGMYALKDVGAYGIIFPANMVPYASGAKAGQIRGGPMQIAYLTNESYQAAKRWGDDMRTWVKLIKDGHFHRTYPNQFGKILCTDCQFMKECFSDQGTTEVPDYLMEER